MHALDWSIVAGLLVVLLVGALRTRKYTRSVSGFLAAERCGGRYLISMANAMAGLGLITLVMWFEMYYENGFTGYWWGAITTEPVQIILALSAWVVYRFRLTRALTLAQFLEMRYSRRFRVFAGLVAYFSGIINFGIFPAVGARFFMAFCGLPQSFTFAGLDVPTFAVLMAGLLSISILFTFLGGHIAVMVTDYLQGIFANVVFAIVIVYLICTLSWDRMAEAMLMAPAGKSLVHPFQIASQPEFNLSYYLISGIIVMYCVLGWQGTQGYYCCAKDAHEAKMAGILNYWRFRVLLLIALVVPIAIRTVMQHPDFAAEAATVQQSIDAIAAGSQEQVTTLQNQLRTPYALAVLLPKGLMGLMCAAMLAAFISTHDTYLHSWGSILIQDVILPFRKRPLSPRQHMWLLRASIFAVAVFIFVFSLLYKPTQFVAMFLAITGAVFVGGAGSAIIGGLYWKRGSTAGAWAAMITGMALALGKTLIEQFDRESLAAATFSSGAIADIERFLRGLALFLKDGLTGQEMTFYAIVYAVGAFILASLLGKRHTHNMDRLLHRGKHAVAGESSTSLRDARTWLQRLGIDREFTGWDRVVAYVSVGWPIAWIIVFVAGTIWYFSRKAQHAELGDEAWLTFWHGFTWFIFAAGVAVTIWFTVGGAKDLVYMFRTLKSRAADPTDDGRVTAEEGDDTPDDARICAENESASKGVCDD